LEESRPKEQSRISRHLTGNWSQGGLDDGSPGRKIYIITKQGKKRKYQKRKA